MTCICSKTSGSSQFHSEWKQTYYDLNGSRLFYHLNCLSSIISYISPPCSLCSNHTGFYCPSHHIRHTLVSDSFLLFLFAWKVLHWDIPMASLLTAFQYQLKCLLLRSLFPLITFPGNTIKKIHSFPHHFLPLTLNYFFFSLNRHTHSHTQAHTTWYTIGTQKYLLN